jgi:peptide deformylase
MPKPTPLFIVPENEIPEAQIVPTDNLLNIFRIITQMEKVCTEKGGIGLSAVQVGIPWKLFIVQRDHKYEYYLNCEYAGVGDLSKSIEGCLSLLDEDGDFRRFEVDRFPVALIKGQQLKISAAPALELEEFSRLEEGLMAVVFQHEIDHQNQILISNIGKEIEIC